MSTSNKYCPKCSEYNGNDPDFYEKYGELGCSGIPYPTGEFPDDCQAHCFSDDPRLTLEEKQAQKIKNILKIIKKNSPEEAAKIISERYR